MKRPCLLGFVIAALFCSGSANGEDLQALLSKFKAETDLARKELLLIEILQHSEAGPQLLALAEKTSDTDRLLRKYERVKDPKEIRAWLMAYHGEAPGQQVMYSFVDWAISNPDGFIAITDGFTDGEQKIFVEGFSDAIYQSSREREFKNAFKGRQTKVLSMTLAELP